MNTPQELERLLAEPKTDQELEDMLLYSEDWTPLALDAARAELQKRKNRPHEVASPPSLAAHNSAQAPEQVPAAVKPATVSSFAMAVEDVFNISDGPVVTGVITRGTVRKGDDAFLVRKGFSKAVRVTKIEVMLKQLEVASAGMGVGLYLQGILKADVRSGDMVQSTSTEDAEEQDQAPLPIRVVKQAEPSKSIAPPVPNKGVREDLDAGHSPLSKMEIFASLQHPGASPRREGYFAGGLEPPQTSSDKPGSLELPPQFDGKSSYRDMFRTQTPEQLRAMCDALPVEQLDLNRPGRPPTAREMGSAITQVFAVATYMATKEVPTEYGDRLFPRLVTKIAQYNSSDLHLELCDLVRDFAIHLEAGGRHKQAIQVMRALRGSLFWLAWSQADVCLFAALNNLALETKQKSDFQAALDFAQDLPPSQAQQFSAAINNLKQKMQPLASTPANAPASSRALGGSESTTTKGKQMSIWKKLFGGQKRDPLDTNCYECHKPLGPGGRRGAAVMSGTDFMSLMEERAVYACKSCGTPFCMDCMSKLMKNPCPACKKKLGWGG